MTALLDLKLTSTTKGSFDSYVNRFDKLIYDLSHTSSSDLTEMQKKYHFLKGIVEPTYAAYKALCAKLTYMEMREHLKHKLLEAEVKTKIATLNNKSALEAIERPIRSLLW